MSLLENAIAFATEKHKGQMRKYYKLPFIVHPLEVMNQLKTCGIIDENILAAAVCHDVLEDCECTEQELYDVLGYPATDVVRELTFKWDSDEYPKKKDAKLSYLRSFSVKARESLLIKIADRLCNIRDFANYDPGYLNKYLKKTESFIGVCDSRSKEIPYNLYNNIKSWF